MKKTIYKNLSSKFRFAFTKTTKPLRGIANSILKISILFFLTIFCFACSEGGNDYATIPDYKAYQNLPDNAKPKDYFNVIGKKLDNHDLFFEDIKKRAMENAANGISLEENLNSLEQEFRTFTNEVLAGFEEVEDSIYQQNERIDMVAKNLETLRRRIERAEERAKETFLKIEKEKEEGQKVFASLKRSDTKLRTELNEMSKHGKAFKDKMTLYATCLFVALFFGFALYLYQKIN